MEQQLCAPKFHLICYFNERILLIFFHERENYKKIIAKKDIWFCIVFLHEIDISSLILPFNEQALHLQIYLAFKAIYTISEDWLSFHLQRGNILLRRIDWEYEAPMLLAMCVFHFQLKSIKNYNIILCSQFHFVK